MSRCPTDKRVPRWPRFAAGRGGHDAYMAEQQKPDGTSSDEQRETAEDEAGEREQGVRSEDSEDLSSPRYTTRRRDA